MSTFKSSKQKGSNLCPVKYFTCTSKVRDKYGNIRGYVIEDDSGKSTQISASNLKNALHNNNIHVTNLKLTSDGRLIDKKQGNQTAHSKISQMTQPNNKETLKPEKLVAVYYRMREEELNKYKNNESDDILRNLPNLSVTQYGNQHYAPSLLDRVAFALGCGLYHIGIFNGRSVYCSKSSGIIAEYGHDAETGIVEPMSEEDEHYISVITTDNNTERAKGIFSKLKTKKQTEDMFRLCLIESTDRKATELCLCTLHIKQLTGDISVALVLYTGDSVRIDSNEIGVINHTILEKANDNLAKAFISLKRKYN